MNIYDYIIGGFFIVLFISAVVRIVRRKDGCGGDCEICPYHCDKTDKVQKQKP